ncbi:MAG TPA: M48 family metallopeptidase [Candidatus Thermoplasmatota archaeon]|jgi:heat shock protein HtpX|nr:M48 family metallopeptidase [Candidatus Thermoplasmatota archaeon]
MAFEDEIARNKRATVLVVALMFALLWLVIQAVAFAIGLPLLVALPIALVAAALYIGVSASFSVDAVLAATQARPANPSVREEKLLIQRVEEVAIAAGVSPPPKVYVQESRDINAFATGTKPENAVVCVTRGALEQLNQEELQGVIGHELGHVLNRDILLATITIGVVGTIALLSEIALRALWWGGRSRGSRGKGGGAGLLLILALVLLVLAPIFSRLVYLAMKRRREYLADATGVQLTRNPPGLVGALRKIAGDLPDDPKGSRTAASLYIENPWVHTELDSVFSTHPPLKERIRRLEAM